MGTPTGYYEAYKKSYLSLLKALPIDDLIPELFSTGVLPEYLKERLDATPVRSEKVKLMFTEMDMEEKLKAGNTKRFEGLIRVMEKFSTDENDVVVRKLARDIRMLINSQDS